MDATTHLTTEDEPEENLQNGVSLHEPESVIEASDAAEPSVPEAVGQAHDAAPPTELADAQINCPSCGASNPEVANYCDECGAALASQEMASHALPPLSVGSQIGENYQIDHLLTQGGGCNVYLASSEDKTFLVKESLAGQNPNCRASSSETESRKADLLVSVSLTGEPPALPPFDEEIKRLQTVTYPALTRFIETLDEGERRYLICTAPRSLAPLQAVHFEGWREVVRAILSLCQTLQKLHSAHTLLNDFSSVQWNPDEGRVFIYELAHAMDMPIDTERYLHEKPPHPSPLSQSLGRGEGGEGQPLWVDPNFTAPEVQSNRLREIGVASDIYALAALCYRLLFGRLYAPPSFDAVEGQTHNEAETRCLPPALHRFLVTGLQPEAINRPESVGAVKNELISLLAIRHHRWGAGSDIGRYRRQNQDGYFAQSTAIYAQSQPITVGLYLVADGMGGAAAGDLASRIVVETCQRSWGELLCAARFHQKTDSEWLHWVSGVLQKANDAIIKAAGGNEMGSTATLSLVINQRAYFAHIGDSRAYLISGENIEQLTDDHSLVARLVRLGALAPEDVVNHPQRHIIYKSLGIERTIAPDCFVRQLSASYALLICSDGLHGMVKDDQLLQVVIDENLAHTEKVNVLINRANEAGGTDNITAVYVTFH